MGWIEFQRKNGRKWYTHKSVSVVTGSGAPWCGGEISGLRLQIIHSKFLISNTIKFNIFQFYIILNMPATCYSSLQTFQKSTKNSQTFTVLRKSFFWLKKETVWIFSLKGRTLPVNLKVFNLTTVIAPKIDLDRRMLRIKLTGLLSNNRKANRNKKTIFHKFDCWVPTRFLQYESLHRTYLYVAAVQFKSHAHPSLWVVMRKNLDKPGPNRIKPVYHRCKVITVAIENLEKRKKENRHAVCVLLKC